MNNSTASHGRTSMKPSELLTKAKAVIADPKHWAQGWYAKDAKGQSVGPRKPDAVCWCSLGALEKVAYEEDTYKTCLAATGYLFKVSAECGYIGIPYFNDNSSHEAVMKAWDKAIKLAKEEENENR